MGCLRSGWVCAGQTLQINLPVSCPLWTAWTAGQII